MMLYSLHTKDFDVLTSLLNTFADGKTPGKIQLGSGWWYHDQYYFNALGYTLFNKFIRNAGDITISEDMIEVKLKKKRHQPLLREGMKPFEQQVFPWLHNKKNKFSQE